MKTFCFPFHFPLAILHPSSFILHSLMPRKLHRLIGLLMLIPMLAWAITGFVFFIKPGYAGAYEMLPPKTYPLTNPLAMTPDPAWLEARYVRTILGHHLLARTAQGWRHYDPSLDPATLTIRPAPTNDEIRQLLTDAFAANPARYGQVAEINGDRIVTTTGVRVTLDWNRLSLQQAGPDTDRIDRIYKIHYLQWTGVKAVDKALGMVGLILIIALSALEGMLLFRRAPK